ncbi:putative oxidoreductase [Diplonema papillatum]|nr:putative oxidoreductase [Diplonema papillatum]
MPKVTLITGSTDGIGKAAAAVLLAKDEGHTVILHGRSQEKLAATVRELEPMKHVAAKVESVLGDIGTLSGAKALAERVKERFPTLNVLVNNAGLRLRNGQCRCSYKKTRIRKTMAKVTLITGSTDDIGKAAAAVLLAKDEGHTVILHGRSQEKLAATVRELEPMKHVAAKVESVLGDIGTLSGAKALAERVKERFPNLNVLVNNAGLRLRNWQSSSIFNNAGAHTKKNKNTKKDG